MGLAIFEIFTVCGENTIKIFFSIVNSCLLLENR